MDFRNKGRFLFMSIPTPPYGGAGKDVRCFPRTAGEKSKDEWLKEVQKLIMKEVLNPQLSVNWLASQLGLSERQFSRRIRQKTGHTAHKFLLALKFKKAHQVLLTNDYQTVREVASALHFSDVKHFSRTFHKFYNLYPSDLR